MQMLESRRTRGSVIPQPLAFPIQLAMRENPVFRPQRLQASTGAVYPCEVDLLPRRLLHRLDDVPTAFFAHRHLHAWLDAEPLREAKSHRIAGLEGTCPSRGHCRLL